MDTDPGTSPGGQRIRLSPIQRRVLGVLIEKGLTTPEYYPLTLKAVVAGCNQRSNREPVTSFDADEVEECLQSLKAQSLTECLFPSSGRTERWRQELGRRWELDGTSLGVLGELLLRGAQSEGELRSRASRMRPVADLNTLREILGRLREREPALVIRLTPDAVQRGVRWAHALSQDAEHERLLAEEGSGEGAVSMPVATPDPVISRGHELPDTERRLQRLESRVEELERRIAGGAREDPERGGVQGLE